MKKSILVYIILLTGLAYCLGDNIKQRRALESYKKEVQDEIALRDKICLLQSAYSPTELLQDQPVYSDSSLDPIPLATLTKRHENTLVYRFAASNCFECVSVQLSLLKQHFKNVEIPVIILASYPTVNSLVVISRENDFSFPYFNILNKSIGLRADGMDSPYFFILSKDLKVKNIFIPEKTIPELTIAYLESIKGILQPRS